MLMQRKEFCYKQAANSATQEGELEMKKSLHHNAYKMYLEAASYIPEDDEMHPYLLQCSLTNLSQSGGILGEMIPLAEKVMKAVEPSKKLWEYSPLSQPYGSYDAIFRKTKEALCEMKRGVEAGEWTLSDAITPSLLDEKIDVSPYFIQSSFNA